MEHHKIKFIVMDYLTDHDIYKYLNTESEVLEVQAQLFTEVINILHHVREYDDDFLYDHFQNLHLLQQQKVISKLLDNICIELDLSLAENIVTSGLSVAKDYPKVFGSIVALSTALSYIHRSKISKGLSTFISKIGEISQTVGEFLVKKGRYAQFQYAIIHQNSEKCYRACNVPNLDNIKPLTYIHTKNIDTDHMLNDNTAKCLSQCYISEQIETSMMLLKLYLICLKTTGKFDNIGKLNDTQIYTLFFHPDESNKKYILSGSCEDYFNLISKTFIEFNNLLSYVYKSDINKHKALTRLYNQIKQVKNEVAHTDIKKLKNKYS